MRSRQNIYLDYNATTPVDERVLSAMLPYFTTHFGNASSTSHAYGWEAEEAVTLARESIARLIGARPAELYFTSGATEAINIALSGLCTPSSEKKHIITCTTEHKAVLDTCHHLETQGHRVTWLEVDKAGNIDLDALAEAITEDTLLVCLMHANNETGVIHPLKAISRITKEKGVLLMTDATQSVGKIPFDVDDLGVDIAAFSAHKLYGPKGAGALYVRKSAGLKLHPLQHGGGQEKGLRPGTLNVPAIAGFGEACALRHMEMQGDMDRLGKLVQWLEGELQQLEGVIINGWQAERLPHMTNVSFENIDGSRLIRSLKGLAVSQGAACSSVTMKPSHVLKSMGHADHLALSSIRIGLGRTTTEEEVKTAAEIIRNAVEKLKLTTT